MSEHESSRKRWIIGLSIAALLLGYTTADDYVKFQKRFSKAERLATGYIVDADPGEPSSGTQYDDGDPGRSPTSYYKFDVGGKTYDGWVEDELAKGEQILVRYNSSDPSFNHAQDDHTTFVDKEKNSLILLFIVIAALVWFGLNKNPLEDAEPEIDIGDGSFESIRQAAIKRLGRELTSKEQVKVRRLADRIQKATEAEKIALQKLADAIDSRR